MSFCHRSLPIVPTGLRIYCCPVSYHIKTFRRKYCACGDLRMPVYELLCLARPLLAKQAVQSMMSKVGRMVYVQGGVVTDIKSYGEQSLAYKIKGVQDKYDKAHIWQLDFAVAPKALDDIKAEMRNNEDVLRWAIVKRGLQPMPSPRVLFHRLSPFANELRPPPRLGQHTHH